MPYEYRHRRVKSDTEFRCPLVCRTCTAKGKSGPCKRTVCLWMPYCWQHTRALLGIRTAESKALPGGTGLFAMRDFAKDEMIAPYDGERLSNKQAAQRYGTGPLALGPYMLHTVDAACARSVASAANGAFGSVTAPANMEYRRTMARYKGAKPAGSVFKNWTLSRDNLGVMWWTVATRDIQAGEELLANYGDNRYVQTYLDRAQKCGDECDKTVRTRKARR